MARKKKATPTKRIRVQFNEEKLMWYKKDDEGKPDWSVHNATLASALEEQSKRRDTDEMKLFKVLTFDRDSAITERQTLVKYFPNILSALPDQEAVQQNLVKIYWSLLKMMSELGEIEAEQAVIARWKAVEWKDYEHERLVENREYRLLSNLINRHKNYREQQSLWEENDE